MDIITQTESLLAAAIGQNGIRIKVESSSDYLMVKGREANYYLGFLDEERLYDNLIQYEDHKQMLKDILERERPLWQIHHPLANVPKEIWDNPMMHDISTADDLFPVFMYHVTGDPEEGELHVRLHVGYETKHMRTQKTKRRYTTVLSVTGDPGASEIGSTTDNLHKALEKCVSEERRCRKVRTMQHMDSRLFIYGSLTERFAVAKVFQLLAVKQSGLTEDDFEMNIHPDSIYVEMRSWPEGLGFGEWFDVVMTTMDVVVFD